MKSPIASFLKLIAQFSFSGIKLFWNSWGVPFCFVAMPVLSYGSKAFLWASTLLFNNVFAPVISSSLTSEGCFDKFLAGDDIVLVTYPLLLCTDFRQVLNTCEAFGLKDYTAEHIIPNIYNFTCGTNMLVSFLPMLFYSYAIISFITPLW
jgi:hypothetical protein